MRTVDLTDRDLLSALRCAEGDCRIMTASRRDACAIERLDAEALGALLRRPRCGRSIKDVFMPAAESVGQYGAKCATSDDAREAPRTVVGVRACELRALEYLDRIFLDGAFVDEAYRARRAATTLVSCDCIDCAESCFCTLVGGRPFGEAGYDLNLTPIDGVWVGEVATEKGERLLGDLDVAGTSTERLERRDTLRLMITDRLERRNAAFSFRAGNGASVNLPEINEEAWKRFAGDCVECAACTNVCPTCHCFYLYDQALGAETFERVRTWDSCLLGTYHRMAGTERVKGTPRPRLSCRLANRVLHKFVYSRQQYGLEGCVGCGRCIDACLGEIDIREVVQELTR